MRDRPFPTLHRLASVALVALGLASPATAEPDVYTWVDESGAVHFSDAPVDRQARRHDSATPFVHPPSPVVGEVSGRVARDADVRSVDFHEMGLQFTVPIPSDWKRLLGEPRGMVLRGLGSSWPGAAPLDVYFSLSGRGFPMLCILGDPSLDSPMAGSSISMLQARFDEQADGTWNLGSFWIDHEVDAYMLEFRFEPNDTDTFAGLMALRPTRRGGLILMSFTWADEFDAYRPVLLRMLRETQVDAGIHIPLPRARSASAPPLGAGPSLGVAVALVCGLLMLMLHTAGWPPLLERGGHVALVTGALCALAALARDVTETREAAVCFGGLVFLASIVAWGYEAGQGRAARSALAGTVAFAGGAASLAYATLSLAYADLAFGAGLAILAISAVCLFAPPIAGRSIAPD